MSENRNKNWEIFNSIQNQLREFDSPVETSASAVESTQDCARIPIVGVSDEHPISSEWLGLMDYVKAIQLQDDQHPRILGLEHPSTITLGKRGDPLKDIGVSIKVLRENKINIVAVDRGGQATIHNQGQLVIYPILNLKQIGLGVRQYVDLLQDVTARFLKDNGVPAIRRDGFPGIYTKDNAKIAFVGVRIRQGWTSHGLAINVRNNTNEFSFIRSCGETQSVIGKMADYGVTTPLSLLFKQWVEYFNIALDLTRDARRPMVGSSLSLRV